MAFDPRKTAVLLLTDIISGEKMLSEAMEMLQEKETDARDRNLCINLVYGVLQRMKLLDKITGDFSRKKSKKIPDHALNNLRIAVYSLLFLDRVPDYAVISSCLNMLQGRDRYLKGYFHSILSRVAEKREKILQDIENTDNYSLLYSLPPWFTERLSARYGIKQAREIILSFSRKPSIFIRFPVKNPSPVKIKGAKTCLEEFIEIDSRDLSGILPKLKKDRMPFYVQSLSSGFVSCLYSPEKDERVLDLCCGKGGKLIHFMDINQGKKLDISAYSHYPGDLPKLRENLSLWGLDVKLIKDLSGLEKESFSLVLLDVPCSGSGILAKAPDIRYRLNEDSLRELASLQRELLSKALELVRPGGRIIYSTCSLLREENEDIIGGFPDRLREVEIVSPCIPSGYICQNSLQVLPSSGMDGIRAFLLEKIS